LGLLAAIVIGRQAWAWWVAVALPIVYIAASAWAASIRLPAALVELVCLVLLLMPSMRRHVGVVGRDRRPTTSSPSRPSTWAVVLGVSGLFVLAAEIEGHSHGSTTIAARIAGAMIAWLLLASAMRLVVMLAGLVIRTVRRGDAPTAPPA
jgi:hypothetical protein